MKFWSLLIALVLSCSLCAQQPSGTSSTSTFTADYPKDRPGIFIQNVDWLAINSATPMKTRAKHGIASSMSYGAVAATIVSEYEGEHASVQVVPGQPIICICHMISLPGEPVLVRLHSKKNMRELDGGHLRAYPVVGGAKLADANKSDLLPVTVSQPESMVWLVRPQDPLTAGEYALMLGTQNVNIFPFTVSDSSPTPAATH